MTKPKINRSIDIPDELIKHLLTESEWRMVKQRMLIINLLKEGLSVRKIAVQAGVGTDTVVRVSKMTRQSGFKKALVVGRDDKRKFRTNTPWIFGKSE